MMKILKYLIIYMSCPFLVFAQSPQDFSNEERTNEASFSSDIPALVKAAEKSVYEIVSRRSRGKSSQGTGFFIAPDFFVTNFHVIHPIESADKFELFQNQEQSSIKIKRVYALDGFSDLAVLQTDRNSKHFLPQGEALSDSDRIFSISYTQNSGKRPVFISSISEPAQYSSHYRIITDAAKAFGSSGSPLINSSGQVIGVIYKAIYNAAAGIPIAVLNQIIRGERGVFCSGFAAPICIDQEIQRVRRELLVQLNSDEPAAENLFHHSSDYLNIFLPPEAAHAYLVKGAENHAAGSQYYLSKFLLDQEEEAESFFWAHQAAEQNDPPSQDQLGFLYFHGMGVDKNREKSFLWFKRSSDQKYTPGMVNTAVSYLKGLGVEQDRAQAVRLLEEAVQYESRYALFYLGLLHYKEREGFEGIIKPDLEKALPLIQQAADLGQFRAACFLASVYQDGIEVEQDQEKSDYWKQKCQEGQKSEVQTAL